MAKSKTKEPVPFELGLVLYTDGGCRDVYTSSHIPAPKVSGYGVHGYSYNLLEEASKTNKKKDIPTTQGYRTIDELNAEIVAKTPVQYHDFWGVGTGIQTNNTAELTAAINAIKFASDKEAKKVTLLTDADYVRLGFQNHLSAWARNGWVTKAGGPVKNRELWEELAKVHSEALSSGKSIQWLRVDGHSGDLGNDSADTNATRGVVLNRRILQGLESEEDGTRHVHVDSDPNGYWNPKSDYNRLLAHPVCYTVTREPALRREDGRYTYFCGTYGATKDHDQDGKRAAGHAFSVLYVKELDPVIELFRTVHNELAETHTRQSDVVRILLNKVTSSKVYADLKANGRNVIQKAVMHTQDLYYTDSELLTIVASPALLAFRSIQYLNLLDRYLNDYLAGTLTHTAMTDVTEYIYQITEVKGKEVIKLTDHISNPGKAIKIPVKYNITGEEKTTPLVLTQILDLPDRNTLSAIAERKPKVTVLTIRESDHAFRWMVVIETEDGEAGIWSSVHSNLKLLMETSK